MTTVAYAKRLGMTDSGVRTIEKSEANDTITLATLRKMAEAMDCEVKYALVPRQPLSEMLKVQAEHIVRKQMEPIAHSMQLEAQGVERSRNPLLLCQCLSR
jgi:predicted DNA-binding mobile mystery protein A